MKTILFIFSIFYIHSAFAEVSFPTGTTDECKTFIETKLPNNYKYGWIQVPEDYSRPRGKMISIFWYSKRNPQQMPVLFLNGGPIGTDRYSFQIHSPMEDRFQIGMIYMDQRGTGCSSIPSAVLDPRSARIASLYASDGIIRDAESLRKVLLDRNAKWSVFGQSYGGVVAARYIEMFPKSLVAVHNVSGMARTNFTDFFYERMKSYLKQLNYFQKLYPDGLEVLQNFKVRFRDDLCIQANTTSLCGKDIYYYIADDLLFTPSTWSTLHVLASQGADCEDCVFKSNGDLKETYVAKFLEENRGGLNFFFSLPFQLRVSALWRQDLEIGAEDGSFILDCERAYRQLQKDGIDVSKMLTNHCRLNLAAQNSEYLKAVRRTIAWTPVRSPMTWKQTVASLKRNPQLKFYVYTGEFDGGATDGVIPQRMAQALPKQIFYTHFLDGDHWSYIDHSLVWQNISGRKLSIENTMVSVEQNGLQKQYFTQGTVDTLNLLEKQSVSEVGIDIGFADQPLDAETSAKLKGRIALVRRGKVSFAVKYQNALNAGAIAVIVGNNNPFLGRPFTPAGLDDAKSIPLVMMSTLDFSELLKNAWGAIDN